MCIEVPRPFTEAVKMKAELWWRCQDVRYARAMEYLPRRAMHRKGNSPKEGSVFQGVKLEKWRHLPSDLDSVLALMVFRLAVV